MAAEFFKVFNPNDTSSVRFNYESPAQRRAKKEAQDAAAKQQAEVLPPGITKDVHGHLLLTDESAFSKWKAGQSEHKDAIAFLEEQASK